MNIFSGPPGKGAFRAPINPKGITLPETTSHLLECDAADLRTTGDHISTAGNDITSSWAGLSGCYSAPEDETLFAALNPVATDGDDVDTALGSVATALETFAETAREIRTRLLVLRGRAEAFNESIRGDDDWDRGGIFGGASDKVGELEDLRSDIARAQEEFTAAEIECANAITALVPGGTRFKSADPDGSTTVGANEFVYGLTEIPDDMATAWGPPAATDHHWWVDVTHAGWDWAAGGVVDIGGMTGTYYEGQWGVPIILFGPAMPLIPSQGQANFQNYWGDTLTGVATLSGFYKGEGPRHFNPGDNPFTRSLSWEEGWYIPESRHEWEDNVSAAAVEAAHGSVSWREWDQRPGYVLTQGTITGVSVAAGGFGLVKGGLGGLRALGRGDFNADALTPDTLRDLLAGGTLRPDGSTGGVPRPNANGADDHSGFDQLDEARETLDDLTEQTQQSSAPSPPPPNRGDSEPSAPAPSDQGDTEPTAPNPPGRGDTEPATPTPTDRGETSVPPRDRDGPDDDASPAQDPTTQQAATQAALERMLRDDPSLAQTLDPDLLELLRANGPDSPWVASPFRDTDGDSVLAGVGGRGDDTLTESAGTPVSTPDRPLDLTDVGDLGPNDRVPDSGPDLRDNTPTITNSAGDGGPPNGGLPHDSDADSGITLTETSPGSDTGSGSSGSSGTGHGPLVDGGDGHGGGAPEEPLPGERHGPQNVSGLRDYNWNSKEEFHEDMNRLINDPGSGVFEEYYRSNGHRISQYAKVGDPPMQIPQIVGVGNKPPWLVRETLDEPDSPDYVDNIRPIHHRTGAEPGAEHLDGLALERAQALRDHRELKTRLEIREAEFATSGSEAVPDDLADLRRQENEAKFLADKKSEGFGEAVARVAVREQFDGSPVLDGNGNPLRDEATNTVIRLPEVKDHPETKPANLPRNGTDQFDDIYRTTDNRGFVILEAKSSLGTGLNARTVPGSNGPELVSQGKLQYVMSVLDAMERRGIRSGTSEAKLAQEIRRLLEDRQFDRVRYVEVRGRPVDHITDQGEVVPGGSYGGYGFAEYNYSRGIG
ncbi:hypothetical protein DFP74_6554 [Nocardiopsis sp. Huas11]|uniref:hypothetical protein n=1 Tax=Nocardiopsis sp. Huas11 TaxID=2183912 RepID=UPI000EACCCB8|nr:hypothetical protein [Nocardiopsis sp. Huas11]RKS10772.1 hypothetical protein DFP74_6554 [Nocardiopsis sp. Huas11]